MRTVLFGACLAALSPSAVTAAPLDVFKDCDVCPEMIELPLGAFVMGAPDDEFRRGVVWNGQALVPPTPDNPDLDVSERDEGPQHKVTVDIRFAMGRNEITYDDWMACVNDGGCSGYVPLGEVGQWGNDSEVIRALTDPRFTHIPSEVNIARAGRMGKFPNLQVVGKYPMISVSYLEALTYVDWLNRKLETHAYRLPSEAEWEYAARAGTTTRFAQGFEPTADQINISGELTEILQNQHRPDLRSFGYPVPVDELDAANPWGLRHMSGNVMEVTMSCHTERYEGWATTSEWLEKSYRPSCERAVRGGAFAGGMDSARVAARTSSDERSRSSLTGFRVVKELEN